MEITYKKNLNFRVRMIAKQVLLFGESSAYQLNDTGNLIWNELDSVKTIDEILNSIKSQYEDLSVNYEKDVLEFLDFLLGINAIKISN
ncbi:PqqD family protein [Paenibacillus wynnii]|uniref:Uncharacterized protein n=1 Tax=Paenibacillus wynnii TaxID=268407 RepID=A0A098M2G5_9BACL|nr:PqqD family protein [Paenibacillus wynnii]KGE16519.1 hypothetical protein PWYN_17470 [Paenibacillus wynnii]